MNKAIALWSGPRNVSTALMYSFANRVDVEVFDEPFFAYFLKETGVWRPSRAEVLATMETDFKKVLKNIRCIKDKTIFTKNMANHLVNVNFEVLKEFKNVILVRNPKPVIASYIKQVEAPTVLDLCYQFQVEIIQYLKKEGLPFYVIDSDEVRKNPRQILSTLCNYLEIPFSEQMLSWPSGPREQDGIWAKYWYQNVHQSTGFMPFEERDYPIEKRLIPLFKECLSIYNNIKSYTK